MLPRVQKGNSLSTAISFCERGYFDIADSEKILNAAKNRDFVFGCMSIN